MLNSKINFDAENKIWYGPKLESRFAKCESIGQPALEAFQKYPDKVFQISANNGVEITGSQLRIMCIRAFQNLQAKGIQQLDVIGMAVSNTHYVAPLVFGASFGGSIISTLDPSFEEGEIKHIYGMTKPKIIFCDADNYPAMKKAISDLGLNSPIYLMKGSIDGVSNVDEFLQSTGKEASFVLPKLKEGSTQTAAILCSSGTTGLPKGVCITHMMLMRLFGYSSVVDHETHLCFSTLYWLSGLHTVINGVLNASKRVIIDEPFTTKAFFDIVEKYRVTSYMSPPSQLAMILQDEEVEKRDLSSILRYTCGGSAVPTVLITKMGQYLPNGFLAATYGMSEIAACATIESRQNGRLGSVGKIIPNVEIKIIDANDESLGVGQQGEICIRIMGKWPGYYDNPKATKEMYDAERWVHSGDLGYFDNDGFLFVVDRKKDILKYKNFHFFPTEIEQVIAKIDDVMEVCVCGLPNMIYTDLPAAVIVKKHGSSLTAEYILEYVKENMSDFKRLRGGVYFVEELPKTASGKVQRNKVKEIVIELAKEMGFESDVDK